MKISIKELKTLKFPYSHSEDLDLEESLVGFEDILDASLCHVEYKIRRIDDSSYEFEFNISISLGIESSITLKRLPLEISSNFVEIYSTDDDYVESEDAILIEDGVIDTYDAVLTEILSNKPMSSHEEDEEFVDEGQDEEYINPYFAALDDILDK